MGSEESAGTGWEKGAWDPRILSTHQPWQGRCPSDLAPSAHPWMVRTPRQAWASSRCSSGCQPWVPSVRCTPDIGKELASYRPPPPPGLGAGKGIQKGAAQWWVTVTQTLCGKSDILGPWTLGTALLPMAEGSEGQRITG